jgi:hypothetical protein
MVSIQVRTGSQATHQYMMMPETQWIRGGAADMYLGTRLDLAPCALVRHGAPSTRGVCEVWGYVWRDAFIDAPVRSPGDQGGPPVLVPTRLLPLRDLTCLESLAEDLDGGPADITPALP